MALPADAALWTPVAFVEKLGISATEACRFSVTRDGDGTSALAIGPWRAGRWSARWQVRRPLPAVAGTFRGRYRTRKLGPFAAEVSWRFTKGGENLRRDAVTLAPAATWTPFAIAVRRPPADADGTSPAVGLAEHGEGEAFFADLAFDPAPPAAPAFPARPDPPTRPPPPARFPAGTRFRLERAAETWWLVAPSGRPFYSVGVDAPGFPDDGEGRRRAQVLRGAGFNSLGGWSNVWRWGPLNDALTKEGGEPFAAFVAIETSGLPGSCARLRDPEDKDGGGDHALPDPDDPAFEPEYRKLVADVARVAAGKPWMAGWFIDNERDHAGLARKIAASRRSRRTPREVVGRYVAICVRAIRAADPGALVFTNRFMLGGFGETAEYLDAYTPCDAVAVNLYPANREPGLSANERAALALVHARTGKPILIGEWSVPALDSGLYADPARLDWSYAEAVDTQGDRARQAARVAMDLYDTPYVVGAHWFTWSDVDSPQRHANRGLYRASGEPWQELLDALGRTHALFPVAAR